MHLVSDLARQLGGELIVGPGTQFEVRYTGKAAHASAFPERGINAADALTVAQVAIGLLRQHLRAGEQMLEIIQHQQQILGAQVRQELGFGIGRAMKGVAQRAGDKKRENADLFLFWGDLLLEKYNEPEAIASMITGSRPTWPSRRQGGRSSSRSTIACWPRSASPSADRTVGPRWR